MTEAVKNIDTISRSECREYAQNFTIKKMVDNYERIYERISKS